MGLTFLAAALKASLWLISGFPALMRWISSLRHVWFVICYLLMSISINIIFMLHASCFMHMHIQEGLLSRWTLTWWSGCRQMGLSVSFLELHICNTKPTQTQADRHFKITSLTFETFNLLFRFYFNVSHSIITSSSLSSSSVYIYVWCILHGFIIHFWTIHDQ